MIHINIYNIEINNKLVLLYKDMETCIVILCGKCSVSLDNGKYCWEHLGSRTSVFECPPDSIYVPFNTTIELRGESEHLKIAIINTEASMWNPPFVVYKNDVQAEIRGRDEWTRTVYNIITPFDSVDSIIVGETIHNSTWSGYPPHKHDSDNGSVESKNNEVYYIEMRPSNSFAVFVQYEENSPKIATVLENNSCITVNSGYHSIVASGGSDLYYLWALDSQNHRFIINTDENFNWINDEK